jgi:hypothetical protein
MTVYTSRFGFQWNYAPHATGWGDGYNTGFRTLSALLHPLLISDIVDTPPSSPIEGDAYYTPTTSTGAWAPYANQIAVWQGGAWQFYPPVTGMRVYFVNHIGFYFWNGATWSPESNLVTPPGSVLSVAGHPPDSAGNVALVYSDIAGAAPLSSPGFTGIPSGPTAASHNNSTQLATTAYVDSALNTLGGVVSLTQGTGILITGTGGAYTISSNTTVMATRSYVDTAVAGAGTGTVTSVAMTVPTTLYTLTGSPITTSGTLALTLNTQNANLVFAGPASGAAAAPTMRALVAADLPAQLQPYIIAGFFAGVPTASQVMLIHRCGTAITFASNFGTTASGADTGGGCLTNATASTVISVDRCPAASDPTSGGSWTQIGTLTIGAGGHTMTAATVGGTSKTAAKGDFIRTVGPVTPDTTAANIFTTLAGDR